MRYRQQVLEGVSESVGVLGARARGHPASDRGWTDEASGRTLPKFVTEELHGFMSRGILGRGFAHLFCHTCHEHHVVAFSCKARAVCPSCLGRRMSEGALNLVDHVLPDVPLRQFVLTVPFPLRFPIAFDGALLGQVVRIFVDTVATWYRRRHLDRGLPPGETGAVAVIQRGNSDLRLNPHLHTAFLDGVYAPDRDRYFGSARQGFFRWEIDLTYHVMRGLELLGLVWNLRCVPEHLLARPDATPRSALSER